MKLVKAQGNEELVNGPRIPKRKAKGTEEPVSRRTNGHAKSLEKKKVNGWPKRGPARLSHYSMNDRIIWQEMRAIKKWVKRSVRPSIK